MPRGLRFLRNPPELVERTTDRVVLTEKAAAARVWHAALSTCVLLGLGIFELHVASGRHDRGAAIFLGLMLLLLLTAAPFNLAVLTISVSGAPATLRIRASLGSLTVSSREFAVSDISRLFVTEAGGGMGLSIELRGGAIKKVTPTNFKVLEPQVALLNDFINAVGDR